jgi:hypothetical protein
MTSKVPRRCPRCRRAVDWAKVTREGVRFAVRACAQCGAPTRPIKVRTKPKSVAGALTRGELMRECDAMVRELTLRWKAPWRDDANPSIGRCAWCHAICELEAAHGISRGNLWLRHRLDNLLPLCRECHARIDQNPEVKDEVFGMMLGARAWQRLVDGAQALWSKPYPTHVLRARHSELGRLMGRRDGCS